MVERVGMRLSDFVLRLAIAFVKDLWNPGLLSAGF